MANRKQAHLSRFVTSLELHLHRNRVSTLSISRDSIPSQDPRTEKILNNAVTASQPIQHTNRYAHDTLHPRPPPPNNPPPTPLALRRRRPQHPSPVQPPSLWRHDLQPTLLLLLAAVFALPRPLQRDVLATARAAATSDGSH